jgi:hypothetical protein
LLGDNEAALKNLLQVQQYFENYSARFAEFFPISCGTFFRIWAGKALLTGKSAGRWGGFAYATADEPATGHSTPSPCAIRISQLFSIFLFEAIQIKETRSFIVNLRRAKT